MNNEFFKNKKNVVIAIVILVLIVIAIWLFAKSPANVTEPSQNSTTNTEAGSPSTTVSNQPSNKPATAKTGTPLTKVDTASSNLVFLVSPVKGEVWSTANPHTIRWNRQMVTGGYIVLYDVTAGKIAGWITPSVTAGQVTYNWDTKWLSLSETNPQREAVNPGVYTIKVVFGGASGSIESAPFSIVSSGPETILTHDITILNSIFSPYVVDIKSGEDVVIVNGESIMNHTILLNGVKLTTLKPKESFFFDSSLYAAGSYEFKIAENAVAKLTVNLSQ